MTTPYNDPAFEAREHRRRFIDMIRGRLGAVFSNLDGASDAAIVEWYRAFRQVPNDVLEDAASRAIERHAEARLQPASFREFVDEALRDATLRRTLVVDSEVCRSPSCAQCGGRGTFPRTVEVGGTRHELTVICTGAKT